MTAIRQVVTGSDLLSRTNGKLFLLNNTFLNLETVHLLDPRDRDLPWYLPWLGLIGRQETEVAPLFARHEAALNQEREFITVMEREIVLRLFPRMVATYQEGLSVTFGKLEMSTRGFSDGKAILPGMILAGLPLMEEKKIPCQKTFHLQTCRHFSNACPGGKTKLPQAIFCLFSGKVNMTSSGHSQYPRCQMPFY